MDVLSHWRNGWTPCCQSGLHGKQALDKTIKQGEKKQRKQAATGGTTSDETTKHAAEQTQR